MPRHKRPVLDPAWVNPEAKARRASQCPARLAAAPAVVITPSATRRPILVASNSAPIARGLIGHPRPKLVAADDQLDRDMAGLLAKFELLEFLDNRTDDNPNVGG